MSLEVNLGANVLDGNRCEFRVWAPFAERVDVHLVSPVERMIAMEKEEHGCYAVTADLIEPGSRYFIRLDGKLDRPDPASRFQPEGVHGPSEVVDHAFAWEDQHWTGIPLRDFIFYELHVGTFTPEGTFDAILPRLDDLKALGVNNIEIMPVSQFPGTRNWGYDGVQPFAVQNSYGGPQAFKRFINACHLKGMSVTLDVVYNHFGPEGNYLRDFGPYFTSKYNTPWGDALNFDDAYSDEVRNFFIQNALYWFEFFHIDALRLDAVHAIYDLSAVPFLKELAQRVHEFWTTDGRQRFLVAESDLNDSRLVRPTDVWGYGLDAQWSDDFHHALHTLLTGETNGYYSDFGELEDLAKALKEGYVYSGRPSSHRKRRHGNFSADLPAERFVVATQNHDQVGNRMLGERLSVLTSFDAIKLAAGMLLLSPCIPLLFMGQEYGETAPFLYFIDHTDPELREAVRQGRRQEFKEFRWEEEPPDPDSEETFVRSRLDWSKRSEGKHKLLLNFYKTLIHLRRETPALSALERDHLDVKIFEVERVLIMRRWWGESEVLCVFNFNPEDIAFKPGQIHPGTTWDKILDSSDRVWAGPGSLLSEQRNPGDPFKLRALSVAVYSRKRTA